MPLSLDQFVQTVTQSGVLSPAEPGSADVLGVALDWIVDPAHPHAPGRGAVQNGRDVVVVSRSSQGWVWPAQLSSWEAQACRVAGRRCC